MGVQNWDKSVDSGQKESLPHISSVVLGNRNFFLFEIIEAATACEHNMSNLMEMIAKYPVLH